MGRLWLGLILAAILLASCVDRTGASVRIAGETIPTTFASESVNMAWGGYHGDAFPREDQIPVTQVGMTLPVKLDLEAGLGATQIRGTIYDVDDPAPGGGPQEEFSLPGRSGSYVTRTVVAGRTYQVVINVSWSFLIRSGEVTRIFRFRVPEAG